MMYEIIDFIILTREAYASKPFHPLTGLFFSLLFAGCDAGPKIAPLDEDSVIIAFGDSLTRGIGATDEQSYPAVLGRMLGRDIINLGIPGEETSRGLERLPAVLDEYNPTLVLLCHGGNDFLRRYPQEETIRNLRSMIGLVRERAADVILIGVPKLGFGLDVPDFYATIAEESQVPYEEDILLDLLGDNEMKSDSIHPNATGYRLMAEAVYDVIEDAQQK
jgi:lysophospholipase L1-like esterase